MRPWRTYLSLEPADRRLLRQAFAAALVARMALWVAGIAWLRRWAAQLDSKAQGTEPRPINRIVWAVQAACRRIPGATCLVSSLALQRVLSRHGHVSELQIGVARNGATFAAHAWIVCEGEVYDSGGPDESYTRLTAWRAQEKTGEKTGEKA
jgi:hypothetical protein